LTGIKIGFISMQNTGLTADFDFIHITASGVTPTPTATPTPGSETIGGGTKTSPAQGPAPSLGTGGTGFVLVKNWNFGSNGTIKNITDLDNNFFYHDNFNQISTGAGQYGALTVASSAATAINGTPQGNQPIEDPAHPVRSFTTDSIKTYIVPLNGATIINPSLHNAGCGSFMPKWTLPNGGSLLGQDILWETRVKYVTPKYYWFALWICGNSWASGAGAEIDLSEGFGYDNGGGYTNYDGRYWHSNSVGGPDAINYSSWANGMAASGINSFDGTQYHTWQLLYSKDNTYKMYCDGHLIQSGNNYYWTYGHTSTGSPVNMSFLFDGGWGHTQVSSVNKDLAASELVGKYYEWEYSRVYLR
jgi:hypothetical protein